MDGRSSSLAVPSPHLSPASRKSSPAPAPFGEKRWRLSLVLPAYNEETGIRQAIEEACAALDELTNAYEVLVVDDGSCDGTAARVAEVAAQRRQVRLLRHPVNRGYGAALRTGFAAARFERVAFTDADCQFHLADLGRMLPLSDRYPLVVGWRQRRQDSLRRRLLSRSYNWLTSALLGTQVRDCDCALKVFQRQVLAELLPESNSFFVNAEILTKARQRGLQVAEVGVRHRPRLCGQSKVSLREVPRILATLLPFWWSRVLFAGDMPTTSPVRQQSRDRKGAVNATAPLRSRLCWLILLLLAGTLFFLRLDAPLLEPQEPRYAEISRQMLSEGRFLVPVLHGEPYLDKPPLLYWLVMGSFSLFGVHDWAARLVPGLAGVVTVLLTYWWGRRVAGERAGFCGALVLCLSAGFIYRQRMLNMDSLLCLWVTAALASAHAALTAPLRSPRLRANQEGVQLHWWLLSAAACGMGFLTKGPVALVLIAAPLLLYVFLEPRCSRPCRRSWTLFVLLAGVLAAPWYVAVMIQAPDFAYTFFWRHHVERFLTPFDHEKPAWFYLPGLLAGMLPWTLLLPGFLRYLGRRSERSAQRRPAALGFFLLSSLLCLVFFSASGCKRPAYILPALPPMALALGCYLNRLVPHTRQRSDAGMELLWSWRSRLAGPATLLVLTSAVVLLVLAGFKHLVEPSLVLLLGTLAVSGFALLWARRCSWGVCAAVTFAVLALGVFFLQPAYNQQFALPEQLRSHAVLAEKEQLSIVCYPQRWDSVTFYQPHADVRVYTRAQRRQLLADLSTRPRTLLLVKSGKALEELMAELPYSVEFLGRDRPGLVTAGWVRQHSVTHWRRERNARPMPRRLEAAIDDRASLAQGTHVCHRAAGLNTLFHGGEPLRIETEGEDFGADLRIPEFHLTELVGPAHGSQALAVGTEGEAAHGIGRVAVGEPHPLARQSVHVRRLVERFRIVGTDVHDAEVVHEEEDDVGLRCRTQN
jgi:4-amino-4-deoxy-L-arabinose transferase-like glycosyltransferase